MTSTLSSDSYPCNRGSYRKRWSALGICVLVGLWLGSAAPAQAQCTSPGPRTDLNDSNGFLWDVHANGQINDGSNDAFDGGMALSVNGAYFTASALAIELSGRQLVHGPVSMSGIDVTRRVYVPATEPWARFLEYFENSTGAPINLTVRIETNLGSDAATVVTATSSGDTSYTTDDRWVATDDSSDGGGDPSLNHNYWHQSGMATPTAVGLLVFDCATTNGLFVEFNFSVAANSTVILMHFGGQNSDRANSAANAAMIDSLDADPEVFASTLFGVSDADRLRIANWGFSEDFDSDGVLDVDDNCPSNANPGQSDLDGDGIGDVCDNCPAIPNPDGQDETAACIAVAPAGGSCGEARIHLLSSTPVFGDVNVEQQVIGFGRFTKPDGAGTEVFDEITPELLIARNGNGGVFNIGSDSTSWAAGTCAAPTTVFYSSHSQLIRDQFRPVDQLLPGSDTCLRDNSTGVDYDIHWESWSSLGFGGFAYSRDGILTRSVLSSVPYANSVLPEELDVSTLANGEYEMCVSAVPEPPPTIDSITFEVLNTCGESFRSPGSYEFFLNGASMGTQIPGGHCTCAAPIESTTITDPVLLANWSGGAINTVGFDLGGASYPYLSWVRANIVSGGTSTTACIFDQAGNTGVPTPGGGDCSVTDVCAAGYTYARSASISFETDEFAGKVERDCSSFSLDGEERIVINGQCNQPPEAICQDVSVAADAECLGYASIDNGSFDPDGGSITLSQVPDNPFDLYITAPVQLTVTDDSGASSSCTAAVEVLDETAPALECNAPATITRIKAKSKKSKKSKKSDKSGKSNKHQPLSITATAGDNCSAAPTIVITSYECTPPSKSKKSKKSDKSGKSGKSKKPACEVTTDGGTFTIQDSGKKGTRINWTLEATDDSDNITSVDCETQVVK